jgi:hypothetical protein
MRALCYHLLPICARDELTGLSQKGEVEARLVRSKKQNSRN